MIALVNQILVVISALLAAEWVIAYHRQTGGAWVGGGMGRHLMAFMGALAAVLGLATVRIVLDWVSIARPDWLPVLRTVVFVSIPAVLVWRRILLARVQAQAPPPKKEETMIDKLKRFAEWLGDAAEKAKAVAAAVGTFASVVAATTADDALDLDELPTLVTAAVTLAVAVYAIVWRVPNAGFISSRDQERDRQRRDTFDGGTAA